MIDPVFIHVSIDVLNQPDVCIASGVAFRAGVQRHPLPDAIDNLDLDVLLKWNDWRDPNVLKRRQSALKYEVLVPNQIEPKYILSP
jgi:hypothetical protein